MNIFELRTDKKFKNSKIEIHYGTGQLGNSLSAYLFDEGGNSHHVYWNIQNDRCGQSFDKTNKKVKDFIINKVNEWIEEQRIQDKKALEQKEKRRLSEKEKIKSLMDSF